jgi:hypothetical protein
MHQHVLPKSEIGEKCFHMALEVAREQVLGAGIRYKLSIVREFEYQRKLLRTLYVQC